MSERKDQEMAPKPDPMDDAAFDRALAADLARPEDEDVALLSRAVLSTLADEGPGRAAPVGEVLAEPLPWMVGFGGLLLLFGGLGYGLVPLVDGGVVRAVSELTDIVSLLGGM